MSDDRRRDVTDPVEEASLDSFPASDPPGWVSLHVGAPAVTPEQIDSDPTKRKIWNAALEEAAHIAERERKDGTSDNLPADIRALKRESAD